MGRTLRMFGALGFSSLWILKSSFWRWDVEGVGHEQRGADEARLHFPKCCWWTDCVRTRVTRSVCPGAGSRSHTFQIRISRSEPRKPQFNSLAVGAYVLELEEFIPRALAEPNTEHQELQWRKSGYFTDKRHHPRQEVNAQKLELPNGLWVTGLEDRLRSALAPLCLVSQESRQGVTPSEGSGAET